jgi:hypothetical protein
MTNMYDDDDDDNDDSESTKCQNSVLQQCQLNS